MAGRKRCFPRVVVGMTSGTNYDVSDRGMLERAETLLCSLFSCVWPPLSPMPAVCLHFLVGRF